MLQIRTNDGKLRNIEAFLNPSDEAWDVTVRLEDEIEFRTFFKWVLFYNGLRIPTRAFNHLREKATMYREGQPIFPVRGDRLVFREPRVNEPIVCIPVVA